MAPSHTDGQSSQQMILSMDRNNNRGEEEAMWKDDFNKMDDTITRWTTLTIEADFLKAVAIKTIASAPTILYFILFHSRQSTPPR